jgi:hypothetical protein
VLPPGPPLRRARRNRRRAASPRRAWRRRPRQPAPRQRVAVRPQLPARGLHQRRRSRPSRTALRPPDPVRRPDRLRRRRRRQRLGPAAARPTSHATRQARGRHSAPPSRNRPQPRARLPALGGPGRCSPSATFTPTTTAHWRKRSAVKPAPPPNNSA